MQIITKRVIYCSSVNGGKTIAGFIEDDVEVSEGLDAHEFQLLDP
jgi:hypothetical protein